uniref:F-box/kelch-repeat protein SKIP11-like n=1 Tax=Erigeron canadensis TaxID=72917 RepID=UPI001CB98639|nr:F-box/kelch-repeat protein SKIP11-like [Erigeron canadensis]
MDLNNTKENMLQDLPLSSSGSKKPKANNNNNNTLIDTLGRDLTVQSLAHCPRYTYGCVATLNRSFRELVRGGDLYKERRRLDVVENWVHFSCNQKCSWEGFDPISRKWIPMPPLITNDPCFDFSDKESIAVGTQLLVLGNDMLGPGIYQCSIQTNSWLAGRPMNVPRCLFGSASVKTKAFFAGGVDRAGRIVDTVESYDSETGNWTTLPSLLKPRKMSSGVYMDGKFYVIGGAGGGAQEYKKALTCGEEYNFDAKTWTEIPNMSPGGGTGSMAPPLLAVVENELYAADYEAMELKLYKKKSNEWVTIGRLPDRIDHTEGWGIAFRGCGERLIILGGPRRDGDTHLEIYSWLPSKGPPEWTLLGRKRTGGFVYNCTIMGC